MKWTERRLLDMLAERHDRSHGNGTEWAYAEHVANNAGFSKTNTLDAMAMHLWHSKGLALHGYEVKCSRSDWLRELGRPEKAEAFTSPSEYQALVCRYVAGEPLVDYFWVVAAPDVVKRGELPEPWGLLVANESRLRQVKAAAPLRPIVVDGMTARMPAVPRGLMAAFMRAQAKTVVRTAARKQEGTT